jgi:hypothetical protein
MRKRGFLSKDQPALTVLEPVKERVSVYMPLSHPEGEILPLSITMALSDGVAALCW